MTRVSTARRPTTWHPWVPLLVVLLLVGVWFVVGSRTVQVAPATPATPTATTSSSALSSPRATSGGDSTPVSGLPTIAGSRLPRQAKDTLALIRAGGPYPHRQDDGVFGNRERILPKQRSGYYREYTVTTPGEDGRGPRRIVAGQDGDLYWTTDHYASFRQILEDQ
jgi:ribonuclease T1